MNKEHFVEKGQYLIDELAKVLSGNSFMMDEKNTELFVEYRDEFYKLKDSDDWMPGLIYTTNRLARLYNSL